MPPTDPAQLREEYDATLPSREERRSILNSLQSQCSAQCGNVVPRAELKVCSRCKLARYCSQACQKTHWRAGHKADCAPVGVSAGLTVKLAERIMAAPALMDYLTLHAVFTLNLLEDRTNADRFAICVRCSTTTDVPEDPNLNGQVVLTVVSISRVPVNDLSEGMKKIKHDSQEMHRKRSSPAGVMAAIFFTEAREGMPMDRYFQTGPEIGCGLLVRDGMIDHVRGKPKITYKVSGEGQYDIDMSPSVLLDGLNNHIRLDTENRLRLRAYPGSER